MKTAHSEDLRDCLMQLEGILCRTAITGIASVAVVAFLLAPFLRDTQAALTPEAVDPFVIHRPAQLAQDLRNPPIPIAAVSSLIGLLPNGFGQEPILLRHLQLITLGTAVLAQTLAGLTLTDAQLLDDRIDGLTTRSWAPQFFEAASRRIAFSRA
jgi:hypothetical protein